MRYLSLVVAVVSTACFFVALIVTVPIILSDGEPIVVAALVKDGLLYGLAWIILAFVPCALFLDARPQLRRNYFWPVAFAFAVLAVLIGSWRGGFTLSTPGQMPTLVQDGVLVFVAFLLFDFLSGIFEPGTGRTQSIGR